MVFSPLVRHMRLVEELKRLRDEAGMTSDQLAKAAGLSRMKVSRLENGVGRPNPNDVMKILDALEVPEPRWTQLVSLTDQAGSHGWWMDYGDHIGARQQIYANLEYGAATICEYQSILIPGLVQTEEYVRGREAYTLAQVPPASKRSLEMAIEARKVRQRMLRRSGGPRYEVVIEENAIRRPAGPPRTMQDQLTSLAAMMDGDSQIEIRVLPIDLDIEDYWIPKSSFYLYTYADADDPETVAIDTETEDLVYADAQHIEHYQQLYRRLHMASLSPEESTSFFKDAAEQFALRAEAKG